MAAGSRARRLEAAASASRLLAEAGVDQTRKVDVFGLCEQMGLWLAFFPLDGLLGSYLPEGSGGALITTQRPVSIQRYTAAHELGHWRLHHGRGPVLDSEEQVLGDTPDESEQLAQIFAAALLMPPPLVYGTLELVGVQGEVSAVHAYAVARSAGVSYEAAVRQLANLEVIGRARASELLKIRPLKVKTEIGQGQRPVVGTADVWPVDERWHGQRLRVHADDEIVISLPENRSTGYRWFFEGHVPPKTPVLEPPTLQQNERSDQLTAFRSVVDRADRIRIAQRTRRTRAPRAALDKARQAGLVSSKSAVELNGSMTLVGDRYVTARAPDMSKRDARKQRLARIGTPASLTDVQFSGDAGSAVVGGTGRRILNVRLHRPGHTVLRLRHLSAYGSNNDEMDGFELDLDVGPQRRGLSIEQLLTSSNPDWAEPVRERQRTFTGASLGLAASVREAE